MKRLNRHLRSTLDANELRNRLLHRGAGPRIAIFDLDGTIHRGVCYPIWKGLSVVDLTFCLGTLLLPRPLEWLAYTKRVQRFRKFSAAVRAGTTSGGERDISAGEIEAFVNDVLKGMRYRDIQRAADAISRLHFCHSRFCIQQLAQSCDRLAFVSRAFTPVLDSYVRRLSVQPGIQFHVFGNALTTHDGLVRSLNPEQRILTEGDKHAVVKQLITPLREMGDAVIFGNGSEDLGMFQAADEILGRRRVLKIAIKPLSATFAAQADVVATSWMGLKRLIVRRNEPIASQPDNEYPTANDGDDCKLPDRGSSVQV